MPVHGFAAASDFALTQEADNAVRAVLHDTDLTRTHYPFAFRFEALYRLEPAALVIELTVVNQDTRPLPYACGLHPGFAWPFAGGAREDYRVVFSQDEDPHVPLIAPGGLFSDAHRRVPLEARALAANDAAFAQEALCFLDARSRSVTFERPGVGAIEIVRDDFAHWALWSRAGAPFLSVETWTGHGDPVGYTGELGDAPSMRTLAPGAVGRHGATFHWRAAD
jgi:galactose mutarotase-like enzyme